MWKTCLDSRHADVPARQYLPEHGAVFAAAGGPIQYGSKLYKVVASEDTACSLVSHEKFIMRSYNSHHLSLHQREEYVIVEPVGMV